MAAEKIRKKNPVVVDEKIQKIWTAGIQNPLIICKLKTDKVFFSSPWERRAMYLA